MKIKTVTIGVLAGAIFGMAAHAGNDNAALTLAKKSVVSKAYADDSFQTKIPAAAPLLTEFFGGSLVAATGTDGVVAPRLILPGFWDKDSAFGSTVKDDFTYTDFNYDMGHTLDFIHGVFYDATGTELPYDAKYSIPSLEFVVDLAKTLQRPVPASENPLGVVLMPTSTAGQLSYRFIIPGLDMNVNGSSNNANQNVRNWALFGGSNNDVGAMLDDIDRYYNNELDGRSMMWLDHGEFVYSPASLKLVSDVWNESQRKIPASGYAAAANGAAAAVAYTNGNGNAATDWLNAAVKGTGIITKTTTAGQIGERKIVEEADVANYAGTALEKISVPTMGAVASYVETHSPTIPAPTGDCLNAANHCALVTTYANGAITYAWTVMAK